MTDKYAVIGNPISHTKSPLIHAEFAKQTGQDLVYTAIEGPINGFVQTVDDFRSAGGRGLNVTLPFKVDAFSYATVCSERARLAGAVNALKFEDDCVFAENFDGVGLVHDIEFNLGYQIHGKKVLLLGAGGATRGALLPILEKLPKELVIANRTFSKAKVIGDQLPQFSNLIIRNYSDLENEKFDIVINATSASLRGELLPLSAQVFSPNCLAYDLVYGKGLTPFLKLAKSSGTKEIADGVGMLVEQAAEAFYWWRGVRPNTRPIITRLTTPLV